MSQFPQTQRRSWELEYGTVNKVVFNFFNAVYAWMAVGLAVTAAVAWYVAHNTSLFHAIYGSPLKWVLILGSVAIAWTTGSVALRISAAAATAMFLAYAAMVGALISGIFLVYPSSTLVAALAMTGGVFGGMTIYGYVTKRDLTKMGSILIMCFWGLFLASIVNIFFANSFLDWVITYGILIVFVGLTAYDTQKLRVIAEQIGTNSDL